MNFELVEYLASCGIGHKERSGEIYLAYCPYCEQEQDGDYSHLSFNAETALFRCKKCDEGGNLWKFRTDRGDVIHKAKKKTYKRPAEDPELTSELDGFYNWYHEHRGINPETLQKFKVGRRKQGEDILIVYQFYNQSGYLTNRKYRGAHNKKLQWQEKDAEPIYYGINLVPQDAKGLIITEGEDDCMALAQLGFKNVVSVPHGASTYTPAMDKANRKYEGLVLVFDNDPAGQTGARKFAEKAGIQKCHNVVLPYKDARECLKQGLTQQDLRRCMKAATKFEMEEITKASQIKEDVLSRYDHKHKELGVQLRFSDFNRIFGGIRMGEMTSWTGHTGHGKTTAALNLCSWVLDAGVPCMILSFENRPASVVEKLVQVRSREATRYHDEATGKVRMCKGREWMAEQVDALDELPLYFLNTRLDDRGYFDVKALATVVEYGVKFYDIRFFVIDHLHYLLRVKDPSHAVHYIDSAVRDIKQLTNRLGIHILLVVHPSKTEDSRTGKLVKLGINCVKGSSSIPQESDNFVVIRRPQDGQMVSKWSVVKNREWKLGDIDLGVMENQNTMVDKDVWTA